MISEEELKAKIRSIPDFPAPGVLFRDITTLLKDGSTFSEVMDDFASHYAEQRLDAVVAVESRGFIFGAPLADRLRLPFIPVRKPGKLPAKKARIEYELEYGTEALEIHQDAIYPGQRVLIVDDLLATGGTILAAAKLVEEFHGEVAGLAFLIELTDLKGREKLRKYDVFSLIKY